MRHARPATEVDTMAFDSKPNGQSPRSPSGADLPEAPRPRPEIWNALREDGIQWEGQVLIVGAGIDIPALLVLTLGRLVLISAGELVLDIPRGWLRPEPKLLAENGVRLSMTPLEGGARAQTDHLTVRVRSGRGAAAKLVSTVSGRIISPREERSVRTSDAPDRWQSGIGASAPMALPPLPEFDDESIPAATRSSWPPVEQHGVPEPPRRPAREAREVAASPARGMVSVPVPTPVPASRVTATHAHTTSQSFAASTDPVHEAVANEQRRSNRGLIWGLRTLILAILVGTAGYFGRDTLAERFDLQLPAAIEERFGLAEETPEPDLSLVPGDGQQGSDTGTTDPVATQADSDGTNGPRNRDTIATGDEETPAVGGDNGEEITPVDPGIGTYEDDAEEPAPTEAPVEPTEAPVEPTDVPVEPTDVPAEPTAVPTDVPPTEIPATEVPTEAPTDVPATEQPTEVPATEEPTESPATEEPSETAEPTATEVPGRQDGTPTIAPTEEPTAEATEEPTVEPTEVPATATSEATLESQPPSVEEGATPAQVLASDGFRYTVTGAARGTTIPDVPQLADAGTGEWVVVTLEGQNWNASEQVFDMSQFRLFADGQEVLLDVGTEWVGGQLGFTPAYGNTEAILWAADESHPLALTFLVPNGAEQLTLVAGDQSMDLTPLLAEPQPLAQDVAATAPEYIEATVAEVVDAETIVIEKDGIQQTVRYLGLDVPTNDDCFAEEATATNREIVEGKTVRIERQATDVDARGNWVRDVWVQDDEGRFSLVAEALVSQGAATVAISEPNTRFESWLMGTQSVAKSNEAGLWGACEQDSTTEVPDTDQAIVTTPQRVTNRRQIG
jgi:endonuclease YncB( thermonuclease family)